MTCSGCGARAPGEATSCTACGAPLPDEDPTRVDEYRGALRALAGRTEDWAIEELRALRDELGIRDATHERLSAERAQETQTPVATPRLSPLRTGTDLLGPRTAVGEDLATRIATAASGARLVVTGSHEGPFVLDRPIELAGEGDAKLWSVRGPVLAISSDVVVRGLTITGAAQEGLCAADAVEVRAGRAVVRDCTLSSDLPGNLVPGRAIAITGPAHVEVIDCRLTQSGVGVAVDVSWSGFSIDGARGARVRMVGGVISGVGTGVAVAGPDREVELTGVTFERITDAGVRAMSGAAVSVEDCALGSAMLFAEPGAMITRASRP